MLLLAIVVLGVLAWRRLHAPSGVTSGATLASYNTGGGQLDNVTEAIARREGFYQQGSIAQRNNNPGAMKVPGGKTFASYPDSGDGWDALSGWVTNHAQANPQWDFYDMMGYYLRGSTTAPPIDAQGDSNSYAESIANYLGVSPTTPVSQVLG